MIKGDRREKRLVLLDMSKIWDLLDGHWYKSVLILHTSKKVYGKLRSHRNTSTLYDVELSPWFWKGSITEKECVDLRPWEINGQNPLHHILFVRYLCYVSLFLYGHDEWVRIVSTEPVKLDDIFYGIWPTESLLSLNKEYRDPRPFRF